MLHVLNLIVVLLLPALTSSFPQSNKWKEIYERLQAGYPDAGRQNPLEAPPYVCCNNPPTRPPAGRRPRPPTGRRPRLVQSLALPLENSEDRSGPLRRALQELSRLQHQQPAPLGTRLLPPPDTPMLLPPGAGLSGLYPRGSREDLLARLLGARAPVLPNDSVSVTNREVEALPVMLRNPPKRGGFVGAPGSAGGPNIFGR